MKKKLVAAIVLTLGVNGYSYGGEETVKLEEIVVTPYASLGEFSVFATPYSIRTYGSGAIEESKADSLTEFLKKDSALSVSDWYGTGIKTSVDLMGFGDTAASNILLLVNGRRVNDIDLSGIDWTQVSIDSVEKIEIIKGAGSVLYGDNSTGGVINVITRRPTAGRPQGCIDLEAGSYSADRESLTVETGSEVLSLYLNADNISLDGYRKNSDYRSRGIYLNLDFNPEHNWGLIFDLGHHKYRYGLPGALYPSEIGPTYSRRDTKYPGDNAHMEDNYVNLGLRSSLAEKATLEVEVSFRNKNGLDNWLSYGIWNYSIDRHIAGSGVKPQVLFSLEALGLKHDIIAGTEFAACDFSADKDDYSVFDADDATDIDRVNRALYLQDNVKIGERLNMFLGGRRQKEKFDFDYASVSTLIDDELDFSEGAYEAGLNYRFGGRRNLFLNFSRGFRVPKVDEYFSVWSTPPVNKDLLPQTNETVSTGINADIFTGLQLRFDFFFSKIDDEIYYNPLTDTNTNYDEVRRRGFHLSGDWEASEEITVGCGYRFVEAEFDRGPYEGKKVPGVAKSKVTLSLNWRVSPRTTVIMDNHYRGRQYLINDLSNSLAKLDDYWLTDVKVVHQKGRIEFYIGINNLFNQEYVEYASTNSAGSVRAYYPSPERNVYGGMKVEF